MTLFPEQESNGFRRRVRIAVIAAPAGAAVVLLLTGMIVPPEFIYEQFGERPELYALLVLCLLATSGAFMLMVYLQTGFKRGRRPAGSSEYDDRELRDTCEKLARGHQALVESFAQLHAELNGIQAAAERRLPTEGALSEEEQQTLVASIARRVHSEAAKEVLAALREQIAIADRTANLRRDASGQFGSTVDRLTQELSALSRRGNLNLVLGIVTTVTGLGILGYFVLKLPGGQEPSVDLLINFIPRLSLVLFIEVFAYFFLRLYKATLAEIKYFQNELTNVESKAIALHASTHLKDSAAILAVIEKISGTDRNSLLEKGQTTVELEQTKLQNERLSSVMKDLLPGMWGKLPVSGPKEQ